MKSIGGYFGLEIKYSGEYHHSAIRLNTGRNALAYILQTNNFIKIYIPFFTCDVLLEPLLTQKVAYEFYEINESFEPKFDFSRIQEDEAFLYTNYFGLKERFITDLAINCKNLILDNSQSFFSLPISKVHTFYSPRKFFGVPDGAYLYSDRKLDITLEKDESYNRCLHLLQRIDVSAEYGYSSFVANDRVLINNPIKIMSSLTQAILSSIDYENCALIRKRNFTYLHQFLKASNKLSMDLSLIAAPMVYPFWSEDMTVRQRLLKHKVYTATYWPNVLEWCDEVYLEHQMVKEIVHLPIDQRYTEDDMELIIKIINA